MGFSRLRSTALVQAHRRQMQIPLIIISFLFLAGCTSDGDSRLVDFGKTIDVARPETPSTDSKHLRVAVAAMISPKETFVHYREMLEYIGEKLNREVLLVQRKTYGEINELLGKGEIDFAFLCSGPYALEKDKYGLELLATPEINGSHFYHAYLMVNERSSFKDLEDLRGKTFAFTDPDSNTGRLVPTNWLEELGERPETFFGQTIYTYSHDNSIMAVAKGMVDGASVDGLIWDFYNRRNPAITNSTRVIRKSAPYGTPPLVASKNLPAEAKGQIRKLLFSMHQDVKGRRILDQLMIDRFIEPSDDWYEGIREMSRKTAPR
ncbi:MAG: phosphate/phosphite/phosphonate ABC transporter substrate-binding protein [Desulfomonile tiedjei]|nr:phosphate/phosphite/phosphonate ABC transporter substrate-binding protein [Desulfomonile tiedjei]